MQLRQKLAYMALGGFLVFMGQLLPHLIGENAIAQKREDSVVFDTVICRNLKVVDDRDRTWVELSHVPKWQYLVSGVGYPIRVTNGNADVFKLSVTPSNAALHLNRVAFNPVQSTFDNVGRVRLSSGGLNIVDDNRGCELYANVDRVAIFKHNQPRSVELGLASSGGFLDIQDQDRSVKMGLGADGGVLEMHANSASPLLFVGVTKNGAASILRDKNGAVHSRIYPDVNGGQIDVFGNDNRIRATIGTNELGHGTIGIWNQQGQRMNLP